MDSNKASSTRGSSNTHHVIQADKRVQWDKSSEGGMLNSVMSYAASCGSGLFKTIFSRTMDQWSLVGHFKNASMSKKVFDILESEIKISEPELPQRVFRFAYSPVERLLIIAKDKDVYVGDRLDSGIFNQLHDMCYRVHGCS